MIIIEDKYQFKPGRPFAPGGELAGVVESLGEGVQGLKVGDRVIGQAGWGGMAEKIAPAGQPLHADCRTAMPFEEGAAFFLTFGTSYHALKQRAAIKPGGEPLGCWAPPGASVWRRWSSQRPWARG